MRWDPGQYARFADHRLRPVIDLLARIPIEAPRRIYDLGCGAGAATRLLAERWPQAAVTGVDSSPDMLAAARRQSPGAIRWLDADVGAWQPEATAELIFSNAALHWLDDHPRLFRRLLAALPTGGTLAVQMPRNHGAATHTAIAELATHPRWAPRLQGLLRAAPVGPPSLYYDILSPQAATLDVWETEYLQALSGADPVVQWAKGTALAPFLQALAGADRDEFLAAYAARMAAAYPRRDDGITLLPFRRLFVVATRR